MKPRSLHCLRSTTSLLKTGKVARFKFQEDAKSMLSAPRLLQLGLLLQLVACSSAPPQNTSNLCSMFEERRSWYKAAMRAEERWHVPISVTMAFIQQESGFAGRARPPRRILLGFIPWSRPSNAFGYAQALEGT